MKQSYLQVIIFFLIVFFIFISLPHSSYPDVHYPDIETEPFITLTAGSDINYPPYEYVDDSGKLTGFNIELLQAVAKATHMHVTFVPDSWNKIRKSLNMGDLDMVSGMFYNHSRAKQFNFSLPHSIVYYSLFIKKGTPIKKIEDIMGKSIIVIEGDIMHDYALSLGFKKDIIIALDTMEAVQYLAKEIYEAALLPRVQTLHILSQYSVTDIEASGPLMLPQEYCFAVQKKLPQVQSRLDLGLNLLKESGEYQKLKQKWFGILTREKYTTYLKVISAGFFVCILTLLVIWIWNRVLSNKIRIHTQDLNAELMAHRRTLSNLEKNEEQLRGVLESSFDAILALNLKRKITRCNPAFVQQFGYAMEEIIGFSTQIIHVDRADYEQFQSTVFPLVEQSGAWRGEWHFKTKKRQILEFEIIITFKRLSDGTHDGYVVVMRDVTERRKAEQERIRLATAIEQSADAILITDTEWNIVFMNAAAEKSGGGDRQKLIGTRLGFLKNTVDSQTDFDSVIESLTEGGIWHGIVTSEDSRGQACEEEIMVSPVTDKAGHTTNYVVFKRDITQLSRLERELNRSKKLEAIGTLAGGIAHDFGNILASLIGYAEMALEDDLEDYSPARYDVEQILIGCHRAKEMVDGILTFSRRSEAPPKPKHIVPLIKEAVNFLKSGLPDTVNLKCEFDCSEDLIYETPAQIYQVMVNLITNSNQALKDQGGHIQIKVSNRIDPATFAPGPNLPQENDTICITVADDGPGMPPEVMERIFDPYFTTKDQSGGSGLGLSMVHGIVTALGGNIDVNSRLGAGTCFTIYLPLTGDREKQDEIEKIPKTDKHGTILLLDYTQETVAVLRHSLIRLGYDVVAASSFKSVLNILKQDPNQFQLFIIDMELSNKTGTQFAIKVAKTVRSICLGLPIILFHNSNAPAIQTLANRKQFDVILQHPLSTRQIAEAVLKTILKE